MLALTLILLFSLLTLIAVIFVLKLLYAFKHFKMKQLMSEPGMLGDIPSVSVCIPARNETFAMTQCLEHVIASTYPKLEIIVLDDSSADNTSHLIKAFAHSGVRFVEGSPLEEGWLGKNYSLQGLLNEASGTLVLFMDVDTVIKPDTIEQLVSYMRQEKASMVSVLPLRQDGWHASTLFDTMRYFWELILHRASSPAACSSAWMIRRQHLITDLNGFNGVRNVVKPEAKLAATLMQKNEYRFLIGTSLLGVSYDKKWSAQVDTSVRLLYPIVGSNIIKATVAILLLLLLNLPTLFVIYGFIGGWTIVQTVALGQLGVFIVIYGIYLTSVWKSSWWAGALLWPYTIAQELVLLLFSVIGYSRGVITWKGRPVTATSLRVK